MQVKSVIPAEPVERLTTMHKLWILAVAGLTLTSVAFGQTASHKKGTKIVHHTTSFERWYRAQIPVMVRAMEKKNLAFFEKTATDDFTYTMGGQTSNKQDSIAQLKQMFDGAQRIKYHYKAVTFKVGGDTATVGGTQSMTAWMKPGTDKKKHVMKGSGKTTETWKKVDGKWMISSITETDSKMTMDGKPMDMGKAGGGG
jgi:hypothetical protein